MPDSLLLRLPHGAQRQACWLLPGEGAAHSGPLSGAAAHAAGRSVVVLVPGSDVLLTSADLPPTRTGAKLQQLVPFALEEQLAEDIDALHFAIGKRLENGRLPVAVVARKRMSEWLEALRAAGIEPAALYADSELLPRNPAQAVALLEDDTVTVRTPSGGYVGLSAEALEEALELALADPAASGLLLYAGETEWQRAQAQVDALRERFESVQVQQLTGDALPLFARALPEAQAINLLQGSYAPKRPTTSGSWRWAAMLLGVLVGLHLIGQVAELMVLHRRERALDGAITRVFHRAMPGEGDPYEARRRMQARLAELRARRSGGGFFAALGALAAARTHVPQTRFETLSFNRGALDLRLTAPSIEALNDLVQALGQQGWKARLMRANPMHGGFRGSLHISRGS